MADFTTRTTRVTRHEWVVPAPHPRGAPAAEIGKAWAVAERAYRDAHGIAPDALIHDDALTVHAEDDQVVIRFTTEETT